MLPAQIMGGLNTPEDEVIPLHRNTPPHYNDYLLEEGHIQRNPEMI